MGTFLFAITIISYNGVLAKQNVMDVPDSQQIDSPYLGQKPPGLIPEVFAPGIVALEGHTEASITFSPDMKELFFQRRKPQESHNIYTMKFIHGEWTEPELAFFSTEKEYLDFHPRYSPDGKRLYFGSTRPLVPDTNSLTMVEWRNQSNRERLHQWYIEKDDGEWGQPKLLLEGLLEGEWVMCVSPAQNGNLYFTSKERADKLEDEGIYYALNEGGKYGAIQRMGEVINGDGKWIAHPFIAPDESYLLYDAERASGDENGDLFISFNHNGVWTESYSLGPDINNELGQGAATVSPDGKYLFFRSAKKGDETSELYWVSTEIFDRLRPEYQKESTSTQYTIAYSSKESGDSEIYLTDDEAQLKFRLTNREGNDGYAAWSPDGTQIAAYAYHDGRKTWSIHTMNIDGTNRKRLTHTKNVWDSAPAWSPDGGKIAFGRAYTDSTGIRHKEIWIMNADGSDQSPIGKLKGGGPHFTQDGRILFHSDDELSEIFIAHVDGTNIIQLTHNNDEDYHPELSPDGNQIAFMSAIDGNHEIYVMNIDGSDQKRLTYNEVRDSTPSWSPDGSRIIFKSEDEKGNRHIYMMNKDGSAIRKFINNGVSAAWFKKYH